MNPKVNLACLTVPGCCVLRNNRSLWSAVLRAGTHPNYTPSGSYINKPNPRPPFSSFKCRQSQSSFHSHARNRSYFPHNCINKTWTSATITTPRANSPQITNCRSTRPTWLKIRVKLVLRSKASRRSRCAQRGTCWPQLTLPWCDTPRYVIHLQYFVVKNSLLI